MLYKNNTLIASRNTTFLFVLLLLGIITQPAAALSTDLEVDGYLAGSMEVRWGFVQGAHNTVLVLEQAGLIADESLAEGIRTLGQCTDRMAVQQLELVFTLWLDQNPSRWQEDLAGLFLEAVLSHCHG